MKTLSFDKLLNYISIGILSFVLIITIFPIYMALMNSLKPDGQILNNILAFPETPLFSNYSEAFGKTNFLKSFFNTFVIVLVGLTGIITFASMAGYKLSRSKGILSTVIFSMFAMSMLIPFHSIMITLTKITRIIGVQGSTVGLGLIYVGLGVPMAIFLYHGCVKFIQLELDEAALMDGCSD